VTGRGKITGMIELLNIDCYEKLLTMEAGTVDLFLQDTPFGVTQNDWDIAPDLKKMWPEWLRVGKSNAAFIFFATQPFAADLINSNRKMFKYDLIWYKALGTGFLNANKMPMRNHESILVFYNTLPTFNPQKGTGVRKYGIRNNTRTNSNYGKFKEDGAGRYDDGGIRNPISVLDFTNGNRTTESDHPTQKPLPLIRYLIKTYSNPGDLVFDGYGGSGTTAVAAELEGRNCILCELDKDYYEAAVKRYNNAIMQGDLFKPI